VTTLLLVLAAVAVWYDFPRLAASLRPRPDRDDDAYVQRRLTIWQEQTEHRSDVALRLAERVGRE
jgi:hypothetical protein